MCRARSWFHLLYHNSFCLLINTQAENLFFTTKTKFWPLLVHIMFSAQTKNITEARDRAVEVNRCGLESFDSVIVNHIRA